MRPTRRALLGLAALTALALVGGSPDLWAVVLSLGTGLVLTDVLLGRALPTPRAARTLATSVPVNQVTRVALRLTSTAERPLALVVHDEPPLSCRLDGATFPVTLRLAPGATADVGYTMLPLERGSVSFGAIVLLLRSPLGLFESRRRVPAADSVRVFPDFSIITSYLGVLAAQQAVQLGLRRGYRRGEGLEFHQLREYRPGDSVRQIDWKATARRRELVSREYQEERDQRVLFVIDSGRRMRAHDGSLSHFDHALNAMLLLAYVALRQGDTVGVKVFGHEGRWIPAQRGVSGVNRLLNESYDLQTGTEAADYLGAAEDVMSRQRKRSLIVLLTNLREEDSDLEPALELLRRRHMVLIGNLRERTLDEHAALEPGTFTEALRVAGAHDFLAARRAHQARCAAGADVLIDCVPQELPVNVVNAYWQLKRSGSL